MLANGSPEQYTVYVHEIDRALLNGDCGYRIQIHTRMRMNVRYFILLPICLLCWHIFVFALRERIYI